MGKKVIISIAAIIILMVVVITGYNQYQQIIQRKEAARVQQIIADKYEKQRKIQISELEKKYEAASKKCSRLSKISLEKAKESYSLHLEGLRVAHIYSKYRVIKIRIDEATADSKKASREADRACNQSELLNERLKRLKFY